MKKFLSLALLAIYVLSGCAAANSVSSEPSPQSTQSERSHTDVQEDEEDAVYGKVTAINGSEITLALGTMNIPGRDGNRGMPRRQGKDGQDSALESGPEKAEGDGSRPQGSGPDGSRPDAPGNREEKSFELLTLSGETKTITVSEDVLGETSLSDIAVDSILKLRYDSDALVSVEPVNLRGPGGGPGTPRGRDGMPEEAAAEQDTDSSGS